MIQQKSTQLTFPVVTSECRGFGLSFVNDWAPTFNCASLANAALCEAGFVGFSSSSRFVASYVKKTAIQTQLTYTWQTHIHVHPKNYKD